MSRPNMRAVCSDALMAGGAEFGLTLAGLHALDSCRIEKAYRHWGHDIGDEDTPLEAGLMFAVKPDKGDFLGRDALLRQRDKGAKRHLAQFLLRDPQPLLYHDEPIWAGGRIIGRTTSGAYGHTLGGAVALGYIGDDAGPIDQLVAKDELDIEVAGRGSGQGQPAHAHVRPKALRIRA